MKKSLINILWKSLQIFSSICHILDWGLMVYKNSKALIDVALTIFVIEELIYKIWQIKPSVWGEGYLRAGSAFRSEIISGCCWMLLLNEIGQTFHIYWTISKQPAKAPVHLNHLPEMGYRLFFLFWYLSNTFCFGTIPMNTFRNYFVCNIIQVRFKDLIEFLKFWP